MRRCIAIAPIGALAIAMSGCKSSAKPKGTPSVQGTTLPSAPASPSYGNHPSEETQIRQEVLLQAALYRAAHETNVGDFTRHFLLEPIQDSEPPALTIEPAEFRRRVLQALADLSVPLAWVTETWRTPDVDYFPGTNERATRLRIKIFDRNENQATVQGEVGDWTADVGSSKQGVVAVWDGQRWNIERDRVRLVW